MRGPHRRSGLKSGWAVHLRGLFLALLAGLYHATPGPCPDNLSHQHCSDRSGHENTSRFTPPLTGSIFQTQTDLDCFGKLSVPVPQYRCTWSPSQDPSVKTYTLLIRQKLSKCRSYPNITGTSKIIRVFENHNMSVELFESSKSGSCRKAFFQGLPRNLVRCGLPDKVSFSWFAGRLAVSVTWQQVEREKIHDFAVRHRAQGSGLWSESPLQSKNGTSGTLESLNSSLAYAVQVRCVSNDACPQCPWSPEYHVPPGGSTFPRISSISMLALIIGSLSELTAVPDLLGSEEEDAAAKPGCRRLSLTWKFSSTKVLEGYRVTIGKASGGFREEFNTTEPRITFILSYSSFYLEITAYNNASTSPALCHTIRRREDRLGLGTEEPNVTTGPSNRSFTISLRDNLTRKYNCCCAEWMEGGRKVAFKPYHCPKTSRTLKILEPLEPYRRYTLTLHVWLGNDTCAMKNINNSESTYGSTQFYFMEGAPVGAPANVSSHNVTLDSAVLQWSSIPEEDARGFLLGYVIYYSGYQNETEKNVTVNPDVNSHTLEGLKSGTLYEVQISGFTRTGVGVRSQATAFTTDPHDNSSSSRIIKFAAIITTVLLCGSPFIKRAKRTLWPSIPNPKKSNMMQQIQMTNELELLQPVGTLRVEELDTDGLQVVQKEQAITSCISADMPSVGDGSEDDFGDVQETHLNAATPILAGGYTTMEMFRQAVSARTPVSQEREPEVTGLRSQLDYLRQFSRDSTWDNQTPQ